MEHPIIAGTKRTDTVPASRKHGARANGRKKPTYVSWQEMLRRCNCPHHANYSYYGGRGIRVCDRWRSYQNFLADMGERPPGMVLDREDSNGNYEPSNCRWVSKAESAYNRRSTKLTLEKVRAIRALAANGETFSRIAEVFGVSSAHIGHIVRNKKWKEAQAERPRAA